MKIHVPVIGLLGIVLSALNPCHAAEITKEQVIAIHESFIDAMHNKDFSIYEKYLYDGTQIFVDLDPAPNNKLQKVELKEFKELAMLSLQMVEEINIDDELISVEINTQKKQATLVSKSTINMTMMGTQITEISKGTTVYGLIDGDIKIITISDEVLASSIK